MGWKWMEWKHNNENAMECDGMGMGEGYKQILRTKKRTIRQDNGTGIGHKYILGTKKADHPMGEHGKN
jgi:hypothetical protein